MCSWEFVRGVQIKRTLQLTYRVPLALWFSIRRADFRVEKLLYFEVDCLGAWAG